MIPRLKAIVLAGGRSLRMGEEKSQIKYQGQSQLSRCLELLSNLELETYISLRHNQKAPSHARVLRDEIDYIGPAAGIISAYHCDSLSAWLVLACDLPLLEESSLSNLIEQRNSNKDATLYMTHLRLEPLAAIWEPRALRFLGNEISRGQYSPRKALESLNCKTLVPHDADQLMNVNTPLEAESAQNILRFHSN